MKRNVFLAAVLACGVSAPATGGVLAPPPPSSSGSGATFMLGLSFSLGGPSGPQPALSAHVLSGSSGFAGALGAHWYPLSPGNQFGLGAGIGYLNNRFGVVGGWDFLNRTPTVGVGYSTRGENDSPELIPD